MTETVKLFNELTANLGVLYIKLHQHHFYVKGHHFFGLHEKFEELYDEVHEQLDEIAERVLMLNGKPVSTLGEFLELSTIKEAPYTTEKSAHDMVKETVEDFKTIAALLDSGIESDNVDEVSKDILIGAKASYDKHIWMLGAFVA
ncbi:MULTISPECIES: DNA starvation/stationary phase protection protein [unclassified Granulicatella]|uniref:Dps family protein n=1 Tax=unclassified Granulicatella TaxID=2630493 RepID=UPI001073457F|nr:MULTISPECIES: DNA starvation/stationary phase protection protein [unclassified Granulicatella]MBF0780782.1 DNA starvation/stationary phase protection protein [Granulicatella sp. 19428wC4_WM01]TFU93827.1 DNA starvation/stationary phase protection protein [Granulicatella sp. WM01]